MFGLNLLAHSSAYGVAVGLSRCLSLQDVRAVTQTSRRLNHWMQPVINVEKKRIDQVAEQSLGGESPSSFSAV